MSNRVRLAMTVRGNADDVRRFTSHFSDRERNAFATIVPLPPEFDQVDYTKFGQQMCIDAWGVKRGAMGLQGPYDVFMGFTEEPRASYRFECDWDVPRLFFEKASKAWPKLWFFVSWALEDNAGGRSIWIEGREVPTRVEPPSMADAESVDDDGKTWERARDFFLIEHDEWGRSGRRP